MKTRKLTVLILTLAMLALCACDTTPAEPTQTPTNVPETSETAETTAPTESEPATEAPATEPTEVKSDYIIKDGVLVGYTGSDTVLTLPEEVEAIAANAFKNAPSATEITAVRLGAKVENIEVGAFSGMYSLSDFEVDAYNPKYYVYTDGALAGLDGTLYLGQAIVDGFSSNLTGKVIYDMQMGETDDPSKFTHIISGPAKIDVSFSGDEYGFICNATAISAYGYTHKFEEEYGMPYQLILLNGDFGLWEGDGFYIYHKDGSDMLILSEYGIGVHSQKSDSPSRSKYTFYREQGVSQLSYTRTLFKYYNTQSFQGVLAFCVARDEFCEEKGTVSIDSSEMIYTPIEVYTVSDTFDLEDFFRRWHEDGTKSGGEPLYATLDELLTANAQKYERGY